jgi:CRP/FNR family cyclic AMP-dependent transcriptional regulator
VGEMSLDGAPRSASVITVEPTTCAVVSRAQFREFILAHPDFALHLIENLIHRARLATDNVKSLALSDVYGRLVRLLNSLVVDQDGRQVVPEKLTQQDIAERVGSSRDMISRLMKDLVAGGYVAVEDRTITLLRKLPPAW